MYRVPRAFYCVIFCTQWMGGFLVDRPPLRSVRYREEEWRMQVQEKTLPKGAWLAGVCILLTGCSGFVRCVCPVQSPCCAPAPSKPEPTHPAIPAWKRWTVDQVLPYPDDQANKEEKVLVPCKGKNENAAVLLSIEGHKIRFCRTP